MCQEFAHVYDEFMEVISYTEWADYIEKIWEKHALKPELVLDLACGTGGLAVELSKRGYDMIGADLSIDMLEEAREKAIEEQQNVLFLQQDMREFELYGTVQSIVCTCDSLNYLLDLEDIEKVFRLADNYLDPEGLFVFDINTEYKYKEVLADNVFADTYEDAAFIWQNEYDEVQRLNEYMVTFFVADDKNAYQRGEELHIQKAYSVDEIKYCIEKAGLKLEAVYDGMTLQEPNEKSERLCFVVREQKKGKGTL